MKTWYIPFSAFWSAGQWGGYSPRNPPVYATDQYRKLSQRWCLQFSYFDKGVCAPALYFYVHYQILKAVNHPVNSGGLQ